MKFLESKFFKPNYSKLLLVMSGVLIGYSAVVPKLLYDVLLFFAALGLMIWSDIIKRKEELKNELEEIQRVDE